MSTFAEIGRSSTQWRHEKASADLPPLYDSIDPDILEKLVEAVDPNQRVRFQYYGYTVSVTSGGSITIDG